MKRTIFRIGCVTYLYVAIASVMTNVYFDMQSENLSYNIDDVLSYNVDRPFLYRLLPVWILNSIDSVIPDSIRVQLESGESSPIRAIEYYSWNDKSNVTFLLVYVFCFGCLVVYLFVKRQLLHHFSMSPAIVDFAPAIGLFALALSFKNGAYIYDFPELIFSGLLLLLALQQKWISFNLILILAILNKETALLLPLAIPAMYGIADKRFIRLFAISMCIGLASFTLLRLSIETSAGVHMQYHLFENLAYLIDPANWLVFESTFAHGLPFPRTINITNMAILIPATIAARRYAPASLKRTFVVLLVPLIGLYLVGGWLDEIRVFGPVFPVAFVIFAFAVQSGYRRISSASSNPAIPQSASAKNLGDH